MDTYRSEEEQVEAIKNWWKENGTSTIVTILVALAAVFGWRSWQDSQENYVAAGAVAYQDLLTAVVEIETNADDIKIATADHMAQKLKDDYASSGYGHLAAFMKARQAVADEDMPLAEQELRWVLANNPIFEMQMIAELRLIKVLFAQGKNDEAMAMADRSDAGAFNANFLEIKGDMLISQKDYQGAVDAYTLAEAAINRDELQAMQTLVIKLGYAKSFL